MPLIISLLLAIASFSRLAVADEVRCWAPDGKTQADNETVVPCNKLGIQQDGVHSSCCRLDGDLAQRDYCTTTGLCLSTLDNVPRREYCTDKTWKSPACINVCKDPNNGGSLNGPVEMTVCLDGTGTYCCGHSEYGCCGTDHAIVIPTQASVISSGGVTQTPDFSFNVFKGTTIGLAAALGLTLATAAGVITWLLRQNKSIKKKLSENNEEASPTMKDSSAPTSPGSGFGNSADHRRISELDASLAVSRSEMGSPVQRYFHNGETSPRSMNSQSHQPHSPFTVS